MKRFLFDIIASFLFVILVLVIIYSIDTGRLGNIIENMPSDIELISFGSSHGAAFNYSDFPVKSTTLSTGGNTLYYDLQNYKLVKENLAPSAIVLIPVSYFSFGADENRTISGTDDSFLNEFYMYLSPSSIYNYSHKKMARVSLLRIQNNFFNIFKTFEIVSSRLNPAFEDNVDFSPENISKINNKYINTLNKRRKNQRNKIKQLRTHGVRRSKRHLEEGTYIENGNKSLPYLEEIIADCQESGFRPFLVTSPFYRLYNKHFEKTWLRENFYSHINYITQNYNIRHIDYSKDLRISNHPLLFRNSDHLNTNGKHIFKNYFYSEFLKNELDLIEENN